MLGLSFSRLFFLPLLPWGKKGEIIISPEASLSDQGRKALREWAKSGSIPKDDKYDDYTCRLLSY